MWALAVFMFRISCLLVSFMNGKAGVVNHTGLYGCASQAVSDAGIYRLS